MDPEREMGRWRAPIRPRAGVVALRQRTREREKSRSIKKREREKSRKRQKGQWRIWIQREKSRSTKKRECVRKVTKKQKGQ